VLAEAKVKTWNKRGNSEKGLLHFI